MNYTFMISFEIDGKCKNWSLKEMLCTHNADLLQEEIWVFFSG